MLFYGKFGAYLRYNMAQGSGAPWGVNPPHGTCTYSHFGQYRKDGAPNWTWVTGTLGGIVMFRAKHLFQSSCPQCFWSLQMAAGRGSAVYHQNICRGYAW